MRGPALGRRGGRRDEPKVLFVYPRFEKYRQARPDLALLPAVAAVWDFTMPPSLAIPTLAAVTPPWVRWRVWDENVQGPPDGWEPDLAAISYFTPQASSAHRLADEFRARGTAVVLGGMHPSLAPREAGRHGDAVCVGEGDLLWPRILSDFRDGALKKLYRGAPPGPEAIAGPKPGVFDPRLYDFSAEIVSWLRGCPFSCSWCGIPLYQGRRLRFRPAETVAAELRALAGRDVYAADDVLTLPRPDISDFVLRVLGLLDGARVGLLVSGSPAMNRDPAFLDALAGAGAKNVYVVFADDPASRAFYSGEPSAREAARGLVGEIERRGMRFFASFGLGYDHAGPGQVDDVLRFCAGAGVSLAEFFIATPYPGTPFRRRLRAEGRLPESSDWSRYNGAHVVFRPKGSTAQALSDEFSRAWRQFYRGRDVVRVPAAPILES